MASFRSLLASFAIVLVAACGGGGSSAPPAGPPPAAATADVTVTVIDTQGRFVSGADVKVASTGAATTTSAAGAATLKVPVGGEEAVTVAKAGFAEQVKVMKLDAAATKGLLRAMLVPRESAVAIAAVEAGGSAAGKHGVKVTFPANALVNAAGQAVTGAIDVVMTPLDVSVSDAEAFPGLFEGVPAGAARGQIVSLGTSELVPQQNGQKLQLANGKTATVELPMYAANGFDGTPLKAGDTVPLWSLDTATGVWRQEGQGTLVADAASPTGLVLRATIAHFSWWNIDQVATRATASVTVTAPAGVTVPAGTLAALQAQLVAGAGPTWLASTSVVVGNAASLAVAAPSTIQFSAAFDAGNQRCMGSAQGSFTQNATTNVSVATTCAQVPVPVIVVPAAVSVTNGANPTRVQVMIEGALPDSLELLGDGVPLQAAGAQSIYIFHVDTAALAEGTLTLSARATKQGVTRDSNAVQVVIDRTGPQVTNVAPAPGSQLSGRQPVTVTFNEPISSANVAQTVVLAVTPTGQTTPVPLAATLSLDTTNRALTVTPDADVPLGTISLSWASVKDAAGNLVTGTIAATFAVDRSVFVGPELAHLEFLGGGDQIGARIVFRADGSLLAAHRPPPGTTLMLSRFDTATNTWVTVVPAVNERPARQMLALGVDGQDVPYIAYTQQQAANPAQLELVLQRLNGNTLELAAPAVPLTGSRPGDIDQGSMAIDGQNRPVIALTDATNTTARLFRLEQGALVAHAIIGTLGFRAQVVMQPNGTALVAYLQGIAGSNALRLRVMSVTNGVVTQLGGDIDSTPNATQSLAEPRLVLVGTEPWVFYIKSAGSTAGRAARFDGTNWIDVPLPTPGDFRITLEPAVLNGDLIVAGGSENALKVTRFKTGAWETPFDATGRADHQDRVCVATQGTSAAMISSSIFRNAADLQRLLFP